MTYHVSMTIEAARKHWKMFGMPKQSVMTILDSMHTLGRKLIQSENCDNFDPFEKGCLGHEESQNH